MGSLIVFFADDGFTVSSFTFAVPDVARPRTATVERMRETIVSSLKFLGDRGSELLRARYLAVNYNVK